jgi:hypothetical protein
MITDQARMPKLRQRAWHGLWYFAVNILSAGLLAVIPFAHAALRVRRPGLWVWTAVYGAIDVVLWWSLLFVPPSTPQSPGWVHTVSIISGLLVLATVVVGSIQLWRIRREVYGWPKRLAPEPAPAPEPAVAAVLAARARRQEARDLATSDPLLARDLHIGRPDLARTYDDGGLVDLNNAPAAVIAHVCELDPVAADKIVSARNQLGGALNTIDELFVLAELPVSSWDRIRDRAVLLPN